MWNVYCLLSGNIKDYKIIFNTHSVKCVICGHIVIITWVSVFEQNPSKILFPE